MSHLPLPLSLRGFIICVGMVMILASGAFLIPLINRTALEATPFEPLEFSPAGKNEIRGGRMGADSVFVTKVTNRSNETIHVTQVSASCSCTSVEIEKMIIEPNEVVSLTGLLRPNPGEKNPSSRVTIGIVGAESKLSNQLQYQVSAHLISAVAVDSSFHDAVRVENSDHYDVGQLTIQNTTNSEVTVDASLANFVDKPVAIVPSHMVLAKGESQTVSVSTRWMESHRGTIRLTIDAGQEFQFVPLSIQMRDAVTAHPSSMILGNIKTINGASTSTFPAKIKLVGTTLNRQVVEVTQHPDFLSNCQILQSESNQVTVDFQIVPLFDKKKVSGKISLRVIEKTGEVYQTIDVPVVGFFLDRSRPGGE